MEANVQQMSTPVHWHVIGSAHRAMLEERKKPNAPISEFHIPQSVNFDSQHEMCAAWLEKMSTELRWFLWSDG